MKNSSSKHNMTKPVTRRSLAAVVIAFVLMFTMTFPEAVASFAETKPSGGSVTETRVELTAAAKKKAKKTNTKETKKKKKKKTEAADTKTTDKKAADTNKDTKTDTKTDAAQGTTAPVNAAQGQAAQGTAPADAAQGTQQTAAPAAQDQAAQGTDAQGNGTTPAAGTQPANGTTPADGTQPANGTTPADGTQPANGTTPADGTQPANGTDPTQGTDPSVPQTEELTPSILDKYGNPILSAGSAALYCENTGEMVFTLNSGDISAPYDLIDLVSALVVVQKLPLDREVTVSKKAAARTGEVMGLKKGEVITVEDLLYGLMFLSADDAVIALAEEVSGSPTKFRAEMKRMAENIGCTDTVFKNVSGDPANGQETTAEDMLKITRVCFSDPTIRKIASSTEYKLKKTNKHKARKIESSLTLISNEDLGSACAKGGSYGETDAGTVCEYSRNGLHLYAVILSGKMSERENDMKALFTYAENKIEGVKAVTAGKSIGKVRVKHGKETIVEVFTGSDGFAYLPKEGSKDLVSLRAVMNDNIQAPLTNGQQIGTYEIYVGDDVVNSVPLVVHQDIEIGWFPSYIGISNNMSVVIASVLCVIAVLMVMALIARLVNMRKRKKIRKRRIRRLAEQQIMEEAGLIDSERKNK